jgi:translation initiation factor IF-2
LRVYELAKKLQLKNKELLVELKALGLEVKSHMSTIDSSIVGEVIALLSREEKLKKITVSDNITPKELSTKIGIDTSSLIQFLLKKGIPCAINHPMSKEVLQLVAKEYNLKLEVVPWYDDRVLEEEVAAEGELKPRPPVVTVMGHVDHGKTKLLDAIRNTNVVAGEWGGITQHIGAYKVKVRDGEVVFLDTPGHEAFTAMRARGANVTDIVVLVVAADDGVMPQTEEAINHARAARVPILVAINKMDLPTADPERVKRQLSKFDLVPEEWGGKTIFVEISALKKTGLDELLEMLLLEAELLELKANPDRPAKGTVIEASLDKKKGAVATLLVQDGTLRAGDFLVAGLHYGKIRSMFDDRGRKLKEAAPSTPVEVLGLSGVPDAGDSFYVVDTERRAREIGLGRQEARRTSERGIQKITLDKLFKKAQKGEEKELNLIVKADTQGSLEVMKDAIQKLDGEVKIKIIHSGVGGINESDVMLAAASKAIVIGFHVRPDIKAKNLGEGQGVDIRTYQVIYELTSDVKQAMEGLLEPEVKEVALGIAEVRKTFRISKVGTIAGSYIKEGKVVRGCKVRLIRDGVVVYDGRISSLRRFKDDVKEVNAGFECGIGLENFNDIKEGDMIEAFSIEKR